MLPAPQWLLVIVPGDGVAVVWLVLSVPLFAIGMRWDSDEAFRRRGFHAILIGR